MRRSEPGDTVSSSVSIGCRSYMHGQDVASKVMASGSMAASEMNDSYIANPREKKTYFSYPPA